MTLGEKIKKYRELRELTQRELGQKVGFSAGTEDSRIRKYEKNMMAPQTDIRRKIAEALDIDMSALNDIDIQTEKDAIRALFYLEEKYEMDIKKTDREIRLTFLFHYTSHRFSIEILPLYFLSFLYTLLFSLPILQDILSVSIYLYYLCQKLNVSPYLSFLYPFRIFLQDKIML